MVKPDSSDPIELPALDEELIAAIKDLYARLDRATKAIDARCMACGECCRLDFYGHQMWLTNLELAFFTHHHGKRPVTEPGVCPFLENNMCTAREGRALGCRVFHCVLSAEEMEPLFEEYLAELRRIAAAHGIELSYDEWLRSLQSLGD